MDSAKGDADIALLGKTPTPQNVVARHLARGYKLLERPDQTYYVELHDYNLLKRAASDAAVFGALTAYMRGDPRTPGRSWDL
jgi:hypothetical protein